MKTGLNRYALPLFMLAVKTNVGYQEVALFIIQNEDVKSIAEGLQIIKDWLTARGVSIKIIMTDNCRAEAEAISLVFPGKIRNCLKHDFCNCNDWLSTVCFMGKYFSETEL